MSQNLTDKFIDELFALSRSEIPEPIRNKVKLCLLDYLGVTIAGARMLREKGIRLLDYLQSQEDEVEVIGFQTKSNIQNAALLNGMSSHIAELDDGDRFGMLHPGAPVFSALLPVAQKEGISGERFLNGVIIGYEAAIRIARALQPSMKERGYHATASCGSIGSALAIAAALGLSKAEMKNALSSAATGASGLLKIIEDESELKPYNVGQAALCGITAAMIARAGFKGPSDVLTGDRGLFSILAEKANLSYLIERTQESYAIEGTYMKPYAACRHAHPAIEAALKIRSRSNINTEEIENVQVLTYRLAIKGHDHSYISGITSAKMSTPYSVAVALELGKAGIHEFSNEYINNPKISNLTKKVTIKSDEELSALFPQKRAAIVKVTTYKKESFLEKIDLPKGEPERPLTEDDVKEKFLSLASYGGKSEEDTLQIVQSVWDLESNMNNLFNII